VKIMAKRKIAATAVFGAALFAVSPIITPVHEATVIEVIDSDTVKATVNVWPGIPIVTSVRIKDIDTPESFKPKCEMEKTAASAATQFVKTKLKPGQPIQIRAVGPDKYFGRAVAELWFFKDQQWHSLGSMLLANGMAKKYDGGKKTGWCGT
jgi:micrococcal nuclease